MKYISRKALIDEILNEAVLTFDDDMSEQPYNKRRRFAGTANMIDDEWKDKPFTRIGPDWKEYPNTKDSSPISSRDFPKFAEQHASKVLIQPPPYDLCKRLNIEVIEHEKSSNDAQTFQFVTYMYLLQTLGIIPWSYKNNLSKKINIRPNFNSKSFNRLKKILPKVYMMWAIHPEWTKDDAILDIKLNHSLSAIFYKDEELGLKPIITKAENDPSIKTTDDLKKFIDSKIALIDKRDTHKLTGLENVAARSMAAIDMKMRKRGYKNGIMNVQNMFEYLKKYHPHNYEDFISTYDINPAELESVTNYNELAKLVYTPESLIKTYDMVSLGGQRHRTYGSLASKFDDPGMVSSAMAGLSKRTRLAVGERDLRKEKDRAQTRVDAGGEDIRARGRQIPPKGSKELVDYHQKKYDDAKAKLDEIMQDYTIMKSENPDEAESFYAEQPIAKLKNLMRNSLHQIKVAKAAYEAALESGERAETAGDRLATKTRNRAEYLIQKRNDIRAELLPLFDEMYDYPQLMREFKPADKVKKSDFLEGVYELSFSLQREDGKPCDRELAEFVENWGEEYINKTEIENNYSGTVACSVIPMEEEIEGRMRIIHIDPIRVIFDYTHGTYLFGLLKDKKIRKNTIMNIILDTINHVESKLGIQLKPYVAEGHGIAVNKPSNYLLSL